MEISWEGRIDQAREIILSAYDMAAGQWVELARHRGDPGGDLRLTVGALADGLGHAGLSTPTGP